MIKRRWIFCIENKLNDNDTKIFEDGIRAFLNTWNAHGVSLSSDINIYYNQVLEVIVDETEVKASGCSIDKMSKKITEISSNIGKKLLDESTVPVLLEDTFIGMERSKLKEEIKNKTITSENLIIDFSKVQVTNNRKDDFIKSIKDSWACSFL